MGPKTLFVVLMKAIGVYMIIHGLLQFIQVVPYAFSDGFTSGMGFGQDWIYYWSWFIAPSAWCVIGIWLMFKGQVLADWAISPATGRCEECGYTVRGLAGNRCPECGSLIRRSRYVSVEEQEHASAEQESDATRADDAEDRA